jgi:hypothetical protein
MADGAPAEAAPEAPPAEPPALEEPAAAAQWTRAVQGNKPNAWIRGNKTGSNAWCDCVNNNVASTGNADEACATLAIGHNARDETKCKYTTARFAVKGRTETLMELQCRRAYASRQWRQAARSGSATSHASTTEQTANKHSRSLIAGEQQAARKIRAKQQANSREPPMATGCAEWISDEPPGPNLPEPAISQNCTSHKSVCGEGLS